MSANPSHGSSMGFLQQRSEQLQVVCSVEVRQESGGPCVWIAGSAGAVVGARSWCSRHMVWGRLVASSCGHFSASGGSEFHRWEDGFAALLLG